MFNQGMSHRGSSLPAGSIHLLEDALPEHTCFDDADSKYSAHHFAFTANSNAGAFIPCSNVAVDQPGLPVMHEFEAVPDPLPSIGLQTVWASASAWLQNMHLVTTDNRICGLAKECWLRIQLIPSDRLIPGFSNAIALSTTSLAAVLGRAWLDDDVINAGGECIMGQLGGNETVQIINCLLPSHLGNMRSRSSSYTPSKPRRLDTRIRNGELHTLLIPLHVHGNHWTLCTIDLLQRTFMYADSRDASAHMPARDQSVLGWWLEDILPGDPFKVVSANFPIPRQTDDHSCAVVVISLMAHILLGYDMWSQGLTEVFRMEWFLRLSSVYDPDATVSFIFNNVYYYYLTASLPGAL